MGYDEGRVLHLLAGLLLPGTAGSAGTPDPYGIFAQARQVWAQQRYPDYLTYTVAVDVTENGVPKAKHYHLAFDSTNGKIGVNPISDEEQAAPPDPNGVTIHLIPKRNFQPLMDKRVGNPGEAVDFLGVPIVSPTYSFGMTLASSQGDEPSGDPLVDQIRKEFNDPVPASKAEQSVTSGSDKTIASVTAFSRRYTIEFAGIETLNGVQCYHLKLTPNYDPQKLRLRELWVETHTYDTVQLVSAGNFAASKVPWLITFDDVNGAQYISSETALAPVGVGDHRYERASISFEQIAQAERPSRPLSFFVTKEALMAEPDTNIR